MEQETEAGHETFCPAGLTRPEAPAGLIEGYGTRENLAVTGLDMFRDGRAESLWKGRKKDGKGIGHLRVFRHQVLVVFLGWLRG